MKRGVPAFSSCVFVFLFLFLLGATTRTVAQDGKLVLKVTPKQAYVFVDGRAISEASKHHTLSLSAGDHKIELANYGFAPESRTVTITAGKSTDLEVSLKPVTSTVSGPFGAMTIEGDPRAAVMLNGKTPDFFVGHVDEFNNDWVWKQELVVPPGTYQVTVKREDKELWSGSVDVPANKRVVMDIPKGVRKTVDWSRGETLKSIPRFTVGTASATIAVAKPTAELSASSGQVSCGTSSQLKWTSTDAPRVEIAPMGAVATSGEQAVQPTQTTNYQLTAVGPGGTATSATTVNVNNTVQANLGLSPNTIQYKRVGDKVVQDDSTVLNWKAENASTVSIDPLGSVNPDGSKTLQITPRKTDFGPVDENVKYTLTATNACGGTTTQTATLHIVGSIEPTPPPELAMRSVYFQTNVPKPTRHVTEKGLLPSEKKELSSIATVFKQYIAVVPDAHLILSGHADKRGTNDYNMGLSERRVQLAKEYLTEQGVPAGNLDAKGYGKQQNLTADQVKELLEKNPELSEADRKAQLWRLHTLVLANNRRVDITLSTTKQESLREYPFKAEDFTKLIDRNAPGTATATEAQAAPKKDKASN